MPHRVVLNGVDLLHCAMVVLINIVRIVVTVNIDDLFSDWEKINSDYGCPILQSY